MERWANCNRTVFRSFYRFSPTCDPISSSVMITKRSLGPIMTRNERYGASKHGIVASVDEKIGIAIFYGTGVALHFTNGGNMNLIALLSLCTISDRSPH